MVYEEYGAYRSPNGYFNVREFIRDELRAEAAKREEKERRKKEDGVPHIYLITTILTLLIIIKSYVVLFIYFFLNYWYWLFIAWVLLPIPEYAPLYSSEIYAFANQIAGPINTQFIPMLNTIFECLDGVRIIYNHVMAIVRALLHIVIVQFGQLSFTTVFTAITNMLNVVYFVVEMFTTFFITLVGELVKMFNGEGGTFDFSFIDLIINILIDGIALALDPHRCFTPVSDIPYSTLECLSIGNLPHSILNRTDIKNAGVDGIVKALIIDVCGKGSLSTDYFDLILDCIDFQSILDSLDFGLAMESATIANAQAMSDNFDALQLQISLTDSSLQAILPTLEQRVLDKLCGSLQSTVYCEKTKTIVSGIVDQAGLLQSINNTLPLRKHSIIINDPVENRRTCIHHRGSSKAIICINSVPHMNRMRMADGRYVADVAAQIKYQIDHINRELITTHEVMLNATKLFKRHESNETADHYRTVQKEFVQQNEHRRFNMMGKESMEYLTNTTTIEEELPSPNLHTHYHDIYNYYANHSRNENNAAFIAIDIMSHFLMVLNITAKSWNRGYRPDTYFFVREQLNANKFDIDRIFRKVNAYYNIDVTKVRQNALTIDITITGAFASFLLYGGTTFSTLLNGIAVVIVGLFMFASFMLGALGALLNALNDTPGFHFDFGANALTAPMEEFLSIGLSKPVSPLITGTLLVKYVTIIVQLVEVSLLNIIRLIMCEVPVNMGSLTCPPEIIADYNNPAILQLTYAYFYNVTMCQPDTCYEGSVSQYGATCVNGTFLCWPDLPYVTIPPINTVSQANLSMCVIRNVAVGRGIAWYRLAYNWVYYTYSEGFKFLVRVCVAGYSMPWYLIIGGLLASRICICVRSAFYPLIYITIFQLAHYPLQYLTNVCPPGGLWGLCNYYQDYILFDKLDNAIPPDALLCNGLGIPVYILGFFISLMIIILILSFINVALLTSAWKDVVITYYAIQYIVSSIIYSAYPSPHIKYKLE